MFNSELGMYNRLTLKFGLEMINFDQKLDHFACTKDAIWKKYLDILKLCSLEGRDWKILLSIVIDASFTLRDFLTRRFNLFTIAALF